MTHWSQRAGTGTIIRGCRARQVIRGGLIRWQQLFAGQKQLFVPPLIERSFPRRLVAKKDVEHGENGFPVLVADTFLQCR